MHLLVDLLAVEDVVAHIGEVGLFLTPVEERPVPKRLFLGLEAQIRKLLVVLPPQLTIDVEEARHQILAGRELAGGITESTSFCISASSIGKSRTRNFFGNSLNQKWPVAFRARLVCARTPPG